MAIGFLIAVAKAKEEESTNNTNPHERISAEASTSCHPGQAAQRRRSGISLGKVPDESAARLSGMT